MSFTTKHVVIGLFLTFLVTTVQAGDAAKGEALSSTCAACHGKDGNSTIPTNPKLAGQYKSYLVQALKAYKSGARQSAIMSGFATALSEQDIKDLAAWFSSQKGDLGTASW